MKYRERTLDQRRCDCCVCDSDRCPDRDGFWSALVRQSTLTAAVLAICFCVAPALAVSPDTKPANQDADGESVAAEVVETDSGARHSVAPEAGVDAREHSGGDVSGDDERIEEAMGSEGSTRPEVSELSVPPSEFISYPDDRPEWLADAPTHMNGVDIWPVVSVPAESAEIARQSLDVMIQTTIQMYAEQTFADMPGSESIRLQPSQVEDLLIHKRYEGVVQRGDGDERFEAAVLLTFGNEARDLMRGQLESRLVGRRLVRMGGATTAGLLALAVGTGVFGLLSRRRQCKGSGPAACGGV
ncbi:hypothetical protein [Crateriforma spongiae]|uniref:hypothetical protein n=1 Tax=Crateriforma spongiae TaxID=2724528 RepID=UPI00144765D0|nr:hypothetical protein [Crateriforma spongiae]